MSDWVDWVDTFVNIDTNLKVGALVQAHAQAQSDNILYSAVVDQYVKGHDLENSQKFLGAISFYALAKQKYADVYPHVLSGDMKMKLSEAMDKVDAGIKAVLGPKENASMIAEDIAKMIRMLGVKIQEVEGQIQQTQQKKLSPEELQTLEKGTKDLMIPGQMVCRYFDLKFQDDLRRPEYIERWKAILEAALKGMGASGEWPFQIVNKIDALKKDIQALIKFNESQVIKNLLIVLGSAFVIGGLLGFLITRSWTGALTIAICVAYCGIFIGSFFDFVNFNPSKRQENKIRRV